LKAIIKCFPQWLKTPLQAEDARKRSFRLQTLGVGVEVVKVRGFRSDKTDALKNFFMDDEARDLRPKRGTIANPAGQLRKFTKSEKNPEKYTLRVQHDHH
jgi:hypothetical protein